jgi:hypothetical protein
MRNWQDASSSDGWGGCLHFFGTMRRHNDLWQLNVFACSDKLGKPLVARQGLTPMRRGLLLILCVLGVSGALSQQRSESTTADFFPLEDGRCWTYFYKAIEKQYISISFVELMEVDSGGVYLYRIQAGEFVQSRKFVLVR